MRVALIPVYCSGTDRTSTFTKTWLQRLGDQVDSFYQAQSGGRLSVPCTAFEWQQIAMTTDEWFAAGMLGGRDVVDALVTAGTLKREDFDHFVILIDDAVSSLGVTPTEAPETSIIAATGATWPFTASNVLHELGHRIGLVHTQLDSVDGPIEYGGPFCIMGFENGKYAYIEQALIDPQQGAEGLIARFGPGVCFPNLVRAGWADPSVHALRVTPYSGGSVSGAIQVSAMRGAPSPGQPAPPVACIVELENWYVIEYRSPVDRYDAGVPNTSPPSLGDIVVYRTPPTGPFVPLQVGSVTAEAGNILVIDASPLAELLAQKTGGVAGTPLKITVTNVDPGGRGVSLRLEKTMGRPPQYFNAEDHMKDYLQWAVSGRTVRGDPVLNAVKALAEIHDLQRVQRVSGPRDAQALGVALQRRIANLQKQIGRMQH